MPRFGLDLSRHFLVAVVQHVLWLGVCQQALHQQTVGNTPLKDEGGLGAEVGVAIGLGLVVVGQCQGYH